MVSVLAESYLSALGSMATGGPKPLLKRAQMEASEQSAGADVSLEALTQYLRTASLDDELRKIVKDLKQAALNMGFVHVESGPLVRSSYHAHETADAYAAAQD